MRALRFGVLSARLFYSLAFLLCLALLIGCGGMSGSTNPNNPPSVANPPGTPGNPGTPGTTPQLSTYLYGTGFADSIAGFHVDKSSGTLSAVQSSFPRTNQAESAKFTIPDPLGRFIFLQQEDDSPASKAPVLSTFKIDPATGALSVIGNAAQPHILAGVIEPKGNFMYTVEGSSLHVYRVDSNANLVQISVTPFVDSPFPGLVSGATTDAAGRFLFVLTTAAEIQDVIHVYALNPDSGTATEVNGSPFATGLIILAFAHHPGGTIQVTPSGNLLYLLASVGNSTERIAAFTISSSGALIPGPVTALDQSFQNQSFSIDPSGRFLYAVDMTGTSTTQIRGLAINANTGALTPLPGSPYAVTALISGTVWADTAVDPTGKFLYVSSTDNNSQIHRFTIDQNTGALSLQPDAVPILTDQGMLFFLQIAH